MNKFSYYKPGVGDSWILVLLFFAGSLILGMIIGFVWPQAPQSVSYILSMALPFAYIRLKSGTAFLCEEQPVSLNRPLKDTTRPAVAVAAAAVAMLALSVVIEPLTQIIPMPDSFKALFEQIFNDSALWDMLLSTCVLAPLLEETLCRGILLRGMLQHTSPVKAILWSALIFAVLHANPWQAIPAFILGTFFGWIYWKTGNLALTMFLHCLNNSISAAVTRIWPDLDIDAGLSDIMDKGPYIAVYVASCVILIVLLYLLNEKIISSEVQADS